MYRRAARGARRIYLLLLLPLHPSARRSTPPPPRDHEKKRVHLNFTFRRMRPEGFGFRKNEGGAIVCYLK